MRAVAAVIVLLLASAASGAARTDIVAVDDFINAPRALFGRTREAVERAAGPPLSVRASTLPPTPTSAAEPAQQLAWAGLVVTVSQRSSAVRRVEISEPRWTLPSGLNVGTRRAQVEAALGEPPLTSDASVLYLDADGFPNTVEFYFRNDRVRRIEWSYAAGD
jgi:hypothetical protein